MKEITDREKTIIDRVLHFDYYGGYDFSHIYLAEPDVLFYGVKFAVINFCCLGIIDDKNVGFITTENQFSGKLVNKRYLAPISAVLSNRDFTNTDYGWPKEMLKYPPFPYFFQRKELRKRFDELKNLYEMFFRNNFNWSKFVDDLRHGKNKRYSERFASFLESDLEILYQERTKGFLTLSNKQAKDPIEDFITAINF